MNFEETGATLQSIEEFSVPKRTPTPRHGRTPTVRRRMTFWSSVALVAASLLVSVPAVAQQASDRSEAVQQEAERRLQQQLRLNQALEERIVALEEGLNADVCVALREKGPEACITPSPLIDFSRIPSGSSDGAAVSPSAPENGASELPADGATTQEETPSQQAALSDASGGNALESLDLVELLEDTTALILTSAGNSGSGFFIAPGLMLTNRHVVEGVDPRDAEGILITSRSLKRPYFASILAQSNTSTPGGADYALLGIQGLEDNPTLLVAPALNKLDRVLAAGYPGLIVANDQNLRDFFEGEIGAAPDLVISQGEVSALQQSQAGSSVVVHTANIMSGNSGGPLVDSCGRVVGINTFITADQTSASRAGFALGYEGILTFLKSHGVKVPAGSGPCTPR